MVRQEQVLSVFVASPNDVADEREKLEEVVRQLNVAWGRDLGMRLELLRWETHAYPGRAEDAQQVVNDEMRDDYDVFVGIMWQRFGTPTHRAESGTLEEFERARSRHDADPNSVSIMMYFKDAPVVPSEMDLAQMQQVQAFRQSLGAEGVLWWPFVRTEDFAKLAELHLTRVLQRWKQGQQTPSQPQLSTAIIPSPVESGNAEVSLASAEDEDLGILDVAETIDVAFDELTQITETLGEAMVEVTSRIEERTAELNSIDPAGDAAANRRKSIVLSAKSATDFERFADSVTSLLPRYKDAMNKGMTALIQSVALSQDLDQSPEDVEENYQALTGLLAIMTESDESTRGFRESVAGMPRMTAQLNRARRAVVKSLDELMNENDAGRRLLKEAILAIHPDDDVD